MATLMSPLPQNHHPLVYDVASLPAWLTTHTHEHWALVYNGCATLRTPDGRAWRARAFGWLGNDWSGMEAPLHGDLDVLSGVGRPYRRQA